MILTLFSIAVLAPVNRALLCGLLLMVGFGALGLYPTYYALGQELSVRHQGKVSGMLGFVNWIASALMHPLVGGWIDRTKDYPSAVALAGLLPVSGFLALLLLWKDPVARSGASAKGDPLTEAVKR